MNDEQIKVDDEYYFVSRDQLLKLRSLDSSLYGSFNEETYAELKNELSIIKRTAKSTFEQDCFYTAT